MTDPNPNEQLTTQESVTVALVAEIIAAGGDETDVEALIDIMYPPGDVE